MIIQPNPHTRRINLRPATLLRRKATRSISTCAATWRDADIVTSITKPVSLGRVARNGQAPS